MTTDELVALYESPDSVPALPALDGLDRVDWSALGDAYGPATKAPAFLRALASTEPEHRNYAAESLFQHIWHQGTVYSATVVHGREGSHGLCLVDLDEGYRVMAAGAPEIGARVALRVEEGRLCAE